MLKQVLKSVVLLQGLARATRTAPHRATVVTDTNTAEMATILA
jgi:hypothetical protein